MEQVKTQLNHLGKLEDKFPSEIKILRQFYFSNLEKKDIANKDGGKDGQGRTTTIP